MTEQGIIVAFCIIAFSLAVFAACLGYLALENGRLKRKLGRMIEAHLDSLPYVRTRKEQVREFIETEPLDFGQR